MVPRTFPEVQIFSVSFKGNPAILEVSAYGAVVGAFRGGPGRPTSNCSRRPLTQVNTPDGRDAPFVIGPRLRPRFDLPVEAQAGAFLLSLVITEKKTMTRTDESCWADRLWADYARRRDPRTREAIVCQFERLAYSIANRFRGKGIEDDDIYQVARIGLVKAVDRFDPATRHRFTSFAKPTIAGELKRYFRDHLWSVHVPRSIQELALQVARSTREMTEQQGRPPRVAELAERLNTSEECIQEVLALPNAHQPIRIDCEPETGNGRGALERFLGRDDDAMTAVLEREGVRQAMRRLAEPLCEVLQLRYLGGLTQRQVAARLGLSQMTVCRMEQRALALLRSQFNLN